MENKPIVEVQQVSMKFNLASEKFDSFKEYFIRHLKKQISYNELWALINLFFSKRKFIRLYWTKQKWGKSTMLKIIPSVVSQTKEM